MTLAPRNNGFERMMADHYPMDPTEALARVRALLQTEPNFGDAFNANSFSPDALRWLGQLSALTEAMKLGGEKLLLRRAEGRIVSSKGKEGVEELQIILYRVLAHAELKAPVASQGAFVVAGNEVDAYGAIAKILDSSENSIFIVDPYLDSILITDFLPAAEEGRTLKILSDQASVKASLIPAAERWVAQYGQERPLEVRLAPDRTLHDRLIIIDDRSAWSLTQSFKDFAKRAHATILKVDEENANLKIAAYCSAWDQANRII